MPRSSRVAFLTYYIYFIIHSFPAFVSITFVPSIGRASVIMLIAHSVMINDRQYTPRNTYRRRRLHIYGFSFRLRIVWSLFYICFCFELWKWRNHQSRDRSLGVRFERMKYREEMSCFKLCI